MSSDSEARPDAVPSQPRTALDFNLPKGDKFLVNGRGQRLHVRTFIPAEGDAKAIIFYHHGYSAHINGPTFVKLANGLRDLGFAVVAMDQHGHGYRLIANGPAELWTSNGLLAIRYGPCHIVTGSEGESVLIETYRHLVDDSLALIDAVAQGKPDEANRHLGMDDDLRQKFQSLPFFLAGQSIGGPLSLLIGIEIKHHDGTWATIADRFKGVMTTSPAIMVNLVPDAIAPVWKSVLSPLPQEMELPADMRVSMVEHLWTNDECAQMGALDTIGKPGGLGWPKAMRVGTCRQILEMAAATESRLSDIDYCFLVLHDPNDGIANFEGTKKLVEEASTPANIARGREVKEMLNMKHDLLSNVTHEVVAAYADWASEQANT